MAFLKEFFDQFLVPYKLAKDSLIFNCANLIILKSNRINRPKIFFERSAKLAHESHRCLSEKVWFPLIKKWRQRFDVRFQIFLNLCGEMGQKRVNGVHAS